MSNTTQNTMTQNTMIECPICDFHYSSLRSHCPMCGTDNSVNTAFKRIKGYYKIVVAKGAERARQLPQSPRFFQLVD